MSKSNTPPVRRRPATPPRRTAHNAAWLIVALLIAVAVGGALVITTSALSPASNNKNAPMVLVTIPSGANAKTIGALLARKHLVRRGLGFVLAARMEGVADKMKAGRYEFSPAMPPRQMAQLIALGETATDVVVVPEGFTVAQIARRLAQHHMVDEKTFLIVARTQGRTFAVGGFRPPNANLEGYLFPDTYLIPKAPTDTVSATLPIDARERQIIGLMLADFNRRVFVPEKTAFAKYPGGLADAVNMASLVEREAEVDGDRPLIAAALTNRLKQGMRLQCDATVQYALPHHKTRLFYADLRVDSPYNTYTHAGLPPTPICNPGLPSIEAALRPAHVDYLFYVGRPDGSHIFSRTLAEHDKAIAQLRAARNGT
jgi:UPF0755 protein